MNLIKRKVITLMSKHFYPQNIFAKSILKYIVKNNDKKILIDVPCGNGETSWHFSTNKSLSVFGYDIDVKSIEIAKSNYSTRNLKFGVKNIFEVINSHTNADYYCIINSLFLLPEPISILKNIANNIKPKGFLFVIVPNINGKNFKEFSKTNTFLNKLVLDKKDFNLFFTECGLKIVDIKGIAFTSNYGRKDVKLFSIFSHFYLSILNIFQTFFFMGAPNYYLIVLQK